MARILVLKKDNPDFKYRKNLYNINESKPLFCSHNYSFSRVKILFIFINFLCPSLGIGFNVWSQFIIIV